MIGDANVMHATIAALYDRIAAIETRLQRAELDADTLRERLRASEAYVAELRAYLCAEPALHYVPPTREEPAR